MVDLTTKGKRVEVTLRRRRLLRSCDSPLRVHSSPRRPFVPGCPVVTMARSQSGQTQRSKPSSVKSRPPLHPALDKHQRASR